MKKVLLLLFSHGLVGFIGLAAGIFILPILVAPAAPPNTAVAAAANNAIFAGQFRRDLHGSDFLHWGDGQVAINATQISLQGKIAPGPDYKLYLSPVFVETEAEFAAAKAQMVQVADVKTFENFIVDLPASINPAAYNSVIVWCERFSKFITAAQYQ